MLSTLLSSPAPDIQGHALAAISTLFQTCTQHTPPGASASGDYQMVTARNGTVGSSTEADGPLLAARIADAIGNSGGASACANLLRCADVRVAGVAVHLVTTLAAFPKLTAAFRRGGAAPALLHALMQSSSMIGDDLTQRAALTTLASLVAPAGARATPSDLADAAVALRELNDAGGMMHMLGASRVFAWSACERLTRSISPTGLLGSPASQNDPSSREPATRIISAFAASPQYTSALLHAGALRRLLHLLLDPSMAPVSPITGVTMRLAPLEAFSRCVLCLVSPF